MIKSTNTEMYTHVDLQLHCCQEPVLYTHSSIASTHWNSLHGLTSSSPVRERLLQFTFNVKWLEFIRVTGKQEARGLSPLTGGWDQLSESSECQKITGNVLYDQKREQFQDPNYSLVSREGQGFLKIGRL